MFQQVGQIFLQQLQLTLSFPTTSTVRMINAHKEKRQRTGALQDAIASNRAQGVRWRTAVIDRRYSSILCGGEFFFEVNDFFDLHQEPTVNFGEVEDFFDGEAGAEGVADEKDALGVGDAEFAGNDVAGRMSRSP